MADIFPSDIDGLLDPTRATGLWLRHRFPRKGLSAFDPRLNPLRSSYEPVGGAVVPWARVRTAAALRPAR